MDYRHINKIYHYVYDTPADSPEREKRLSELSDSDSEALYDFTIGLMSGRIKESDISNVQKGDDNMTYKEYRTLKNRASYFDETKVFRFEKENPELATSYMIRMLRDAEKKRKIMAIENPDERYLAIAKNKDLF
ncbi:MAG: hypothetical protein HFG28_12710 [Eubacterium sp.]|nr:hypothetical protein [Eubacterium sp.]